LKIPLKNDILNFIFPKICIISDIKLNENNSNQFIDDKVLCSFERVNNNDIIELKSKLKCDHSLSFFRFHPDSDFQKVIYSLKYGGMKTLGFFLGSYLAKEIVNSDTLKSFNQFNLMTSVPLHKIKFRERGYNQSDFISRGMNEILRLKYSEDIILRIKNTKTQTHLTVKEREMNVKNAFAINSKLKNDLNNSNIILVDDVVTTGATLNEIIKLLRRSGVNKIMCISLAMAVQ
jgi:ComF family protein